MRIRNIEEVIEKVRTHLPEYLNSIGINPRKPFRCFNSVHHKNGDANPSAGIVKRNPEVWNCLSCGTKGDIFLAAHYAEQMEVRGQGFIETVRALAERFKVELEEDEDAEEIIKAHNYIATWLKKGLQKPEVQSYVESRNFESIADEFGIGCADPAKLQTILTKTYDLDFINRNDLCNRKILNNRMVFPLHDDSFNVVGYASRALGDEKPKYINSSNSSIYQKSKFLYNLCRIKGKHAYVVEGYADVWRMYQNELEAVATCGTAFTEEHLKLLERFGITELTFVFDGDKAGMDAMERTKKLIENCLTIRCNYIILSAKDKDPDMFIVTHGKEEFLKLERISIDSPYRKKKEHFLNRVMELNEKMILQPTQGYKTMWGFYDLKMENVQKGLHLVGGISNIGKTAWMCHLMINLITYNEDLFALYISIDDDLNQQVPRFIANLGTVPVNQAKNPLTFITNNADLNKEQKEEQWKRRNMGYNRLVKFANDRLAILDINDASTLEDIEREVKLYQEITGKQIALFIDNFHKVRSKGFANFKERFTHISEEIKRITIQHDLITFSTVELTKLGHDSRPDPESIKESVDIIYDAQTIHMLHQDFHSKQGDTQLFHESGRFPGKRMPILEVNITKNKISGYKGRLYYKFYPDIMYFEECDGYENNKYREVEV